MNKLNPLSFSLPTSLPSSASNPDLTKETLVAAANRDDAAMKELLRGSGERAAQVDRVRLALGVLQSELGEAKKEEKARIARAARELMDEHLGTVREELKTKTDSGLEDLEKNMTNARAVAVEEERAATNMLSIESVQLETGEIVRDIKEGDWKTWAKYLAAAAVAGIGAKWVWDHSIGWLWKKAEGTKQKPGLLRRATGWLVGLGAAGLGAIGLSRYGRLSNKLLDLGKAGVEGAKEGWEATAGTTLERIAAIAGDKGRTAEVKRKFDRGEYKTEEEYEEALADALFYDRLEMVWEGTALHLYRGAEHITLNCTPRLIAAITSFAINRDLPAGQEVFRVYMDGTIAYATTFGGIAGVSKFFQTGGNFKAALMHTATESLMWPVQVLKKANDVRYLLFTHEGHVTMQEIRGLPNYYWNRLVANKMNPRNWLGLPQSPERLEGLVSEWQDLKGMLRSIHGSSNKELVESLTGKLEVVEKELMNSVTALKQQRAAGTLGEITSDVRRLLDKGDNLGTVLHTLEEMGDASGTKIVRLMDEWIAVQRTLNEADAAGNALVKSHSEQQLKAIADEMDETLAAIRGKLRVGEQVDGITPAVQKLLDEGTDSAKLARLLKTGSATEDAAKAAKTGVEAAEAGKDAAQSGKTSTNSADDAAKAIEEGTEATADAGKTAKGAKTAAQAGAATEAATDAVETGDEWARAASQVRKALLAPNATQEAIVAVDDAVMKCKALGLAADDAVKAMKDPNVLLALTRTPANQVKALAVAIEGGDAAANMSRMCAFVAKFADHLDDAAKATILLDKSLLRTVMNSGLEADAIADILKNPAIRTALLEGKNVEKIMKDLIWWKNATSLHTIINVGGAVISAAMLVNDIVTLVDRRKQLTEAMEGLGKQLASAGFEKKGDSYEHTTTKKRINISVVESSIDNMSNPQWLRVAGSGVGTIGAIGTLAFPAMAVNPLVGLAVLGIELTVQGAATVWEDENTRQFLLDTPTSILSVIDLNKIIQKDSKAVLDDASTWMWSDILHSSDTNVKNKDDLRKKAVAIMFFHELNSMTKESPEVAATILRPRGLSDTQDASKPLDAGSFLDEKHGTFFKEDFEKIVKPFLAARLFQMSKDSSVKWSEFRELKIDEGTFDLENIAPADMRLALREAAHVYAQYLKEKDYADQKKKVGEQGAVQVDEKILTVQSIAIRAQRSQQLEQGRKDLQAYGDQAVFGKKVSELDDGSGVTATERYLQDLTKRLDSRANATTAEAQKAKNEIDSSPLIMLSPLTANDVGPRGDERSIMGKQEIFTGKNPGADGNVRLEDVAGVSGRDVERPISEADMKALIEKGRSLYGSLEGVGTWGRHDSVWYAQPSHFQLLKEYSYSLQRSPTLSKERSVTAFLSSVKQLGEGFSWEDGYFGSEFLAKRNDAFRDALAALRAMNDSLDARTYHFAKAERGSVYEHVLCLPNQETKFFTDFDKDVAPDMRGDPSVLYVEHDGKTVEIKPPVAGQEYSHEIPGYGKFTCAQEGYMKNGKPAYHHRWTFQRAPDAKRGAKDLYAYFKYDGAEQPGTKISLPEVKVSKKILKVDQAFVLDDASTLYTGSRITIVYRDKDGKNVEYTGSLYEIVKKHPVGWRAVENTNPKTGVVSHWTRLYSKDGATLVGCTVQYLHKPERVEYVWKPQQAAPLAKEKPAPAKKVSRAA